MAVFSLPDSGFYLRFWKQRKKDVGLKDALKDRDQENLDEALKDDDPEVIVIPAVESRHKRIHEKLSRPEELLKLHLKK